MPSTLMGLFQEEPRYTDLRWARTQAHLSLSDPRFRSDVADAAAALHRRPDEITGEEVRQHRRTLRVVASAVALVTALAIVAAFAAAIAADATEPGSGGTRSRDFALPGRASTLLP